LKKHRSVTNHGAEVVPVVVEIAVVGEALMGSGVQGRDNVSD
jgi:hypothetical protein